MGRWLWLGLGLDLRGSVLTWIGVCFVLGVKSIGRFVCVQSDFGWKFGLFSVSGSLEIWLVFSFSSIGALLCVWF